MYAGVYMQFMGRNIVYELIDYYADRPGHDPRYMLDGRKLAALGWKEPKDFESSLGKTIAWTLSRDRWLK